MSPIADTKSRIQSAALDLFLEHGIRETSMRKIADIVGITAPALYRHYDNKAAIFTEIVQHAFRVFTQYLSQGLKKRSAQARMNAVGSQYCEFVIDHPREYRMMFLTEWGQHMKALEGETLEESWQSFQILVDRVREMQSDNLMVKDLPAEFLAQTIWSVTHGQAALYLMMNHDHPDQSEEALVPQMTPDMFRQSFHFASGAVVRGLHPDNQ